jgi:septal ring factor EnvC (AmiA/AmiB activator)
LKQRLLRLKADLTEHKLGKSSLEKRLRTLDRDFEDLKYQVKELKEEKIQGQRELVVVRRERNFLAESMRELQNMI